MSRNYRSVLKPGTPSWAWRRALWRAQGLTDEDLQKPKIAVVNSSSQIAICFSHLDEVSVRVQEAIRAAGAIPFEVRTTAPSDFITSQGGRGGYILSARDLIVNDIEAQVEGAMLDGMICLASCDKTPPAHIMAAGRLNIPTLVLCCGYQPSGVYRGQHCDIEDVFTAAGGIRSGKYTIEEVKEMSEVAIQGPGVCPGLGTANTMHAVCESLGMSLPGSTPVMALSRAMWDYARAAAERIVEMVEQDLKPRSILTPAAFENAVMTMLCISGSMNSAKHMAAIAQESGVDVDVYGLFEKFADKIPLLTAVRPNGEHTIEQFEAAGGTRAVMKQLETFMRKDALTVTGKTVGENLAGITVADEDIIRPVKRAYGMGPTLVMMKGSLAPEGGIIKLSVTEKRDLQMRGPAIVFEQAQDALDAIGRGDVKPGHVVILRGVGPRGTPGMGMASAVVFAVLGADLTGKVAIVTDGQLSGLTNVGITMAEAQPEAANGGPIGLVENGDMIAIVVAKRTVDIEVAADVLEARRSKVHTWQSTNENGWLAIYRRLVLPMRQGSVLMK
ncbi:dihydroxy-acid dehydratase [Xanthobacteraceae bacterium Astr-EGSB]|uniref:dihydroxy-acid dehydratase n=1 Tax=Astrobacterium formosum TaxID=3069710 RepID=UPI0027B2F9B3|nr:dihydroxy-acid dehydratase [Xanthobacteraceae bacterium Astr-EGSB]